MFNETEHSYLFDCSGRMVLGHAIDRRIIKIRIFSIWVGFLTFNMATLHLIVTQSWYKNMIPMCIKRPQNKPQPIGPAPPTAGFKSKTCSRTIIVRTGYTYSRRTELQMLCVRTVHVTLTQPHYVNVTTDC
jgi:hypothetical protein